MHVAIIRLILVSLLLMSLSCASKKDFASYDNGAVSESIAQYLQAEEKFEEDFLLHTMEVLEQDYCPKLSEPYWIVPSPAVPDSLDIQKSNNNVSIAAFNERLFLAFRTGPTHFASKKTGVHILSTADGRSWREELRLFFGKDVREPFLIPIGDRLHFYCFTAGTRMSTFEPEQISHYTLDKHSVWSGPEPILQKGEVHWSLKRRNGHIFMSSYEGEHYQVNGPSEVSVYFKQSTDGVNFFPAPDSARVYFGGVSECAYEFDYAGNLWALTRLEDGDKTGFGSHIAYAHKEQLWNWQFPDTAAVDCYMSPKMFNHNDELYLIARRQLGRKPFGRTARHKSMKKQRLKNWISYSLSGKTTALFKLNKSARKIEWLMDLPGAGDTAFPSILRLDEHRYLIANYSSPIQRRKDRSWLSGQLGRTGIYLQILEFAACD